MRILSFIIITSTLLMGFQVYGAPSCAQLLRNLTAEEAVGYFDFPENANFRTTDTLLREAIYEAFGGIDYYTKKPIKFREMTIDHVIPKSKKGPNNVFNYVPTSADENQRKGADFNWSDERKTLIEIRAVYGPKVMKILENQGVLDLMSGHIGMIVVNGQSVKGPGYHIGFYGLTKSLSSFLSRLFLGYNNLSSSEKAEIEGAREFSLQDFQSLDLDSLEADFEGFSFNISLVGKDLRERPEVDGPLLELIREDESGFFDDSNPRVRLHPQIISRLKSMGEGVRAEEVFTAGHIDRREFEVWREGVDF